MLKGILRNLILSILLLSTTHPIYAGNDYFWLLQEYGIEKRAMSDGALLQNFSTLTKPLAFSIKPQQRGIWAIADGFLISFDAEANIVKSQQLNHINQKAYLISMREGGVWLLHDNNRYSYDEQLNLSNTLQLPTKGQQINDVAYDYREKNTWVSTSNHLISISNEADISLFDLEKNEKINGITISKEGNIALIIATPRPEFRLYSDGFELLHSHRLENITPAPENIVQARDGRYWVAGKQHVLLLNAEQGIEVNYEYDGQLEQGPGEPQLVTDEESAWVAVGRNLLHIDTQGHALNVMEEETKKIDVQKDPKISHPPVINPQEQNVSVIPLPHSSMWPPYHLGSYLPYWQNHETHLSYPFTIDIQDEDNDLLMPSLQITNDSHPIEVMHGFHLSYFNFDTSQIEPYDFHSPFYYFPFYRLLNTLPNAYIICDNVVRDFAEANTITCIYRYPTSSHQQGSGDETIPLALALRDGEGNVSNTASATIQIDRTPPSVNRENITLSIQGDTASITGKPGSSEPGSILVITDSRRYGGLGVVVEADGSFATTIPIVYPNTLGIGHRIGDTINLTFYDASGNASTPISLDVGYLIDVNITSHQEGERVSGSFEVSGTYDTPDLDHLATYVGFTSRENTFENGRFTTDTITYTPYSNSGSFDEEDYSLLLLIVEAKRDDGGYGIDEVTVQLDLFPPAPIAVHQIESTTLDGTTTLNCPDDSNDCAEPRSTITIINIRTGDTITTNADDKGLFTAGITGNETDSYILYATDSAGNTGIAKVIDRTPPSLVPIDGVVYSSSERVQRALTFEHPAFTPTLTIIDSNMVICYQAKDGITFCDTHLSYSPYPYTVHTTNTRTGEKRTNNITYDHSEGISLPLFGNKTDSFDYYIEDKAGNTSELHHFDRSPPVINEELISLSITGTTATLKGLPGSIMGGTEVLFAPSGYILNTLRYFHFGSIGTINTINSDGSFIFTFEVIYKNELFWPDTGYKIGDSIRLHSIDDHNNVSSLDPYTIGHRLDIRLTSHIDYQLIGPAFTLEGTHNSETPPSLEIDYEARNNLDDEREPWISMTFHVDTGSFSSNLIELPINKSLTDKDFSNTYIIPIKATTSDGGLGTTTITLNVDQYPPKWPTITYPYVSFQGENVTIQCNKNYAPCAEPGATLHSRNTETGATATAPIDINGQFTLSTTGSRGDRFEFYVKDIFGNKSTSLTTQIGQEYSLHLGFTLPVTSSHRVSTRIRPLPPYTSETGFLGTVTVNGITANGFVAYDVPLSSDSTFTAIYTNQYGGYGEKTITVDSIAPAAPAKELISITSNFDFYTLTGNDGCAEPGSLISILNLDSGYLYKSRVSETGSFTARFSADWGDNLSIFATDSAYNVGEAVQMPTGYPIDVTITYPENGAEFQADPNYIAHYVRGTHSGPNGTVVRFMGGGTPEVNGNNFSGIAFADTTFIDNNNYSFTVYVNGPNNGWGSDTISLTLVVQQPNKDLISLAYGDETVTLTGEANTVFFDSIFTISNTRTGVVKTYRANNDGSFSVPFPAEKGDTLTLIALDDNFNESKPTLLELGYVVDLFITSPEDGAEISGETITVSGTHTGPATSTITVNGIPALINGSEFTASNVSVDESGVIEVRLDDGDGAYGASSITTTRDTTPPAIPNLDLIDTTFSAANHVRLVGQPGSVEGGATLTITNTAQNESKTLTVADDGSFSTYIPGLAGETLTLVAADAVGNQSDSATLQLGTEAMITIETPLQGSTVPALQLDGSNSLTGLVTVTGSHAGPVNSGIVVNGVIAAVTADRFVALNVPVSTDGILTAKLTALDGSHGSNQISVSLLEQPHLLSLTPSSTEGVAPHSVNFKWNAYTTETPDEVSIDYDGDGTFDQTSSDLTTPLQHDYTAAGINNVTLRITMADGTQYTSETMVVTQGDDHYDAIFLSLWNGMNNALLANEPLVALNYLERRAQGQFHNTFRVISPRMQAIIDSYRTPARSAVNDSFLEYIVPRVGADSNLLYYIYCVRESDGSWRIKEM